MNEPTRLGTVEVIQRMEDNWPEVLTPTSRLMIPIYRLNERILNSSKGLAANAGLHYSAFETLLALRSSPAPHQLLPTDLYQAIHISSGGLTKALGQLEDMKLVVRPASKGDKRSKPVRLTAKGRKLAERVMPQVLKSDANTLKGALSAKEQTQLTKLMTKLIGVVDQRPA